LGYPSADRLSIAQAAIVADETPAENKPVSQSARNFAMTALGHRRLNKWNFRGFCADTRFFPRLSGCRQVDFSNFQLTIRREKITLCRQPEGAERGTHECGNRSAGP